MPRNSSGTYTLPSGNPVISGTVIASDWANTTMPDLGNGITDSLSRSGEGGMLAPLKHVDGTAAAPAVTWTNEITSGWYRFGAGEIRFSLLTNDVIIVTDSQVQVMNTITGGGLERVLTTSDLAGAGTPPSYNFSSAVVTLPDAHGLYALAIGNAAQAQYDNAIAIGNAAQAQSVDAIAIGTTAESFSPSAVAVGPGAYAPAPNTLALGHDASAGASGTVSVGFDASSTGNDAIAIGTNATSGAGNAVTIGLNSASNAPDNVTIGNGATSNGPDCVSLGTGTVASGQGIVAVGEGVSVVANDGISIGPHSSVASLQSIAIGSGASAPIGDYSVAIGPAAEVSDASAIVIKAGSVAAASPGANSITLATSATNSVEYYQGKFRLNNASAQIIVPEHADATALSGEAGSLVLETGEGLRYDDGTNWQTVLDAGTDQTVSSEKTFTDTQRFQYGGGSSGPAILIGADNGSNTVTDSTVKTATISAPRYSTADPNTQILQYQSTPSVNQIKIGADISSSISSSWPSGITLGASSTISFSTTGSSVTDLIVNDERILCVPPVGLFPYAVASPPSPAAAGDLAYFSNGDSGSPCLGVYDGTSWKRIPLGATISA